MSTSGDSERGNGVEALAEGAVGGGARRFDVAAVLDADACDALRAALEAVGGEVSAVGDLPDALVADPDLVVAPHDAVASAPSAIRRQLLDPRELDPVLVVVEVPESARAELLAAGVDLALVGAAEAEDTGAQIAALLRRVSMERDRSPLTGMPGTRWLLARVRDRLDAGETLGLLLLDVDDFKEYNDRRGHLHGDAAIRMLAGVAAMAGEGREDVVAAHIGGDDFCIAARPGHLDDIARGCGLQFDRAAHALAGDDEKPLTVSLVATEVGPAEGDRLARVFTRLAALKRRAKQSAGSTYLRERG